MDNTIQEIKIVIIPELNKSGDKYLDLRHYENLVSSHIYVNDSKSILEMSYSEIKSFILKR